MKILLVWFVLLCILAEFAGLIRFLFFFALGLLRMFWCLA